LDHLFDKIVYRRAIRYVNGTGDHGCGTLGKFATCCLNLLESTCADRHSGAICGKSPGDSQADAEIGWIIQLIGEIRSVRAEMNVPAGAKIPLLLVAAGETARKRAEDYGETIRRMARLEDISFAAEPPKGAVQIVLDDGVAALPLADIIDLDEERARLKRAIDKVDDEIGKIGAKLANKGFTDRAPEHVVEEQRERMSDAEETRGRLRDALKRLEGVA
jgi:valyl-tRNA synthetase